MLPRSVPSLLGGFPESLREELQGFVSDPDWEEGRNKPAFEYAKVAQSLLMSGFEEDDFRWAYSVCPAASPPRNDEADFTRVDFTRICCIHHTEGYDFNVVHSARLWLLTQPHKPIYYILLRPAVFTTLLRFTSSEQRGVFLGERCRPRGAYLLLQVVNSRAFAELIPKKMMYLAPLLDMMDHGGWRQMLGYKPEDRPDILDIDNVWSASSATP